MDRPWLAHYPAGVPAEIDPDACPSLPELLRRSFARYAERPAFAFMGRRTTYAQWDRDSAALAAWLQQQGLRPGERIALMMPNVPQYPIAAAAALRAGLVVVNVNPLYTPRELEHQLRDSGASAIVLLENFAATLEQVSERGALRVVLISGLADMLGAVRRPLVHFVVRRVRHLVRAFSLPGHRRFLDALREGRGLALREAEPQSEEVALLQYTGGTTGVSKGAALSHRNLVANVLQSSAWNQPALRKHPMPGTINIVCALPLYHIFAFTVVMMLSAFEGNMIILVANPRDLKGTIAELSRYELHVFPAVNTLYNALLHHPDFSRLNISGLRVSLGGGMAVQEEVARQWLQRTGCPISEGYGLSETSPSVCCNPTDTDHFSGSIGMPLPSTELIVLDEQGQPLPNGQVGELAVRGPQVMRGYWNREQETRQVFTDDGFFRTGDLGVIDAQGYVRIVDRKKDMILVSGFNVYPNEIEDVAVSHPGVLEAAAVGVPDADSGEAVLLFVVRSDPALDAATLRAYLAERLTGYKRPRRIEFRDELPKTPVGKILRRTLREQVLQSGTDATAGP